MKIQELLSKSQQKNHKRGIYGILLFSEGNFYQVIDGPTAIIKQLWEKIKKDDRHHSIIKIFEERAPQPSFDNYLCDYICENDVFQYENLKEFFDHLKLLDEKLKNAAEEVLKQFLKYQ
tara:strand:+ start:73944 stop:74300 length:357 start_codon:yes stop_codon:yes gene_type:complete